MNQPLSTEVARRMADIIADGHAYERHVGNARLGGVRADKPGEGFGSMSRTEFRDLVQRTLTDPNLRGFRHNDGSWTFQLPARNGSRDIRIEADFSPRGTHGAFDFMTAYPLSPGRDMVGDVRMARDRNTSDPRNHPYHDVDALRRAIPDIAPRLSAYEQARNRHFEAHPRPRVATDAELAGSASDVERYRRQQPAPIAVPEHSTPPEPSGRRPTLSLRPRVGGTVAAIAGTFAAAAVSAQEMARADGHAKPTAAHYARAAWDQTIAAPAAQGRYAEFVLRTIEMVDPTMGMLSGGLRSEFRRRGADVDPSMFDDLKGLNGEQKRQLARNTKEIGYLNCEQFFTLQKSGLTDLRDDQGKRIDMAGVLRDPARREIFITNLENAHDREKRPDEKQKLRDMIDSCHQFLGHEPRREAILASTDRILGRPVGAPAPEPVTTAVKPQEPGTNRPGIPGLTS